MTHINIGSTEGHCMNILPVIASPLGATYGADWNDPTLRGNSWGRRERSQPEWELVGQTVKYSLVFIKYLNLNSHVLIVFSKMVYPLCHVRLYQISLA